MTAAWWVLDGIILTCAAVLCVLSWNLALGLGESGAQWLAVLVVAPMMRASLETLALRRVFSRTIGRKGFWLLCLANAISLTAAIYTFVFYATAHPPEA